MLLPLCLRGVKCNEISQRDRIRADRSCAWSGHIYSSAQIVEQIVQKMVDRAEERFRMAEADVEVGAI